MGDHHPAGSKAIVTDTVPACRRRWQFPLWSFLIVPVVCAPLFWNLAQRNRVGIPFNPDQMWCWDSSALLWPQQGALVGKEDRFVVKLARVNYNVEQWGRDTNTRPGQIWKLSPDGLVHTTMGRSGYGYDEYAHPAPPQAVAQLPALLQKLPPSDPAAIPGDRLFFVIFPVNGRYEVRTYRRDALPQEVDAIAKALKAFLY